MSPAVYDLRKYSLIFPNNENLLFSLDDDENPFKKESIQAKMKGGVGLDSIQQANKGQSNPRGPANIEPIQAPRRQEYTGSRPENIPPPQYARAAQQQPVHQGRQQPPLSNQPSHNIEKRYEENLEGIRKMIKQEKDILKSEHASGLNIGPINRKPPSQPIGPKPKLTYGVADGKYFGQSAGDRAQDQRQQPKTVLRLQRIDDKVSSILNKDPLASSQVYMLDHRGGVLGRGPDNTITINSENVSLKHCEFVFQNDSFHLRDIGSTWGTYYRISEKKIEVGEIFELGWTSIEVKKINRALQPLDKVVSNPIAMNRLFDEQLSGCGSNWVELDISNNREPGKREATIVESGTIGRKSSCTISIMDDLMSGLHASIYFKDGSFWIRDENSMNG